MTAVETKNLLERVDLVRVALARRLSANRQAELGQFLTPPAVSRLMAGLFDRPSGDVRLLDPGAGIGSLSAAVVDAFCRCESRPSSIHVTAYEIDEALVPYLRETLGWCAERCGEARIVFTCDVREADFIESVAALFADGPLLAGVLEPYTHAILNPPYRKIHTKSKERQWLREIGLQTSNLYTGFMAAAIHMLSPKGEMVSISPRSFCNGPYFRPFRELLLSETSLRRLHLFDSRNRDFRDDDVLQETMVMHVVKGAPAPETVSVTSSADAEDDLMLVRELAYADVIHPGDRQSFIHLVADGVAHGIAERIAALPCTLKDLGLTASTGRVIDFRSREHLRMEPGPDTVPLVYPLHFQDGYVSWPQTGARKPNALAENEDTAFWMVPNGNYVLTKRFSAKEEPRRLVAAVWDESRVDTPRVGFENHLNYYHRNGGGLPIVEARGLSLYLNSSIADAYFRQFSGHTQVNVADLRNLRYPSLEQIRRLGTAAGERSLTQEDIDQLVEKELPAMDETRPFDQAAAARRIKEGIDILTQLGMPRQQRNDRSAMTLLALLDLAPNTPWAEARTNRLGITPIMDYVAEEYRKQYAPNSRETFRRQTVHQFLDAGLIIANPDNPERPINSGKTVYEIEPGALELMRTYGTEEWETNRDAYLATRETLREKYDKERRMTRIPLVLEGGAEITLSPGGQNVLVKQIIEEFAPRYVPGGKPILVGDTDDKFAYFDEDALAALGVTADLHGKWPDVILFDAKRNWLFLIEAVTSHGPIDGKRRIELRNLFGGCTAGLVYVTTFLDRKIMAKYLPTISWETEVWVADSPSRMIHFNGERFLGPYPVRDGNTEVTDANE